MLYYMYIVLLLCDKDTTSFLSAKFFSKKNCERAPKGLFVLKENYFSVWIRLWNAG